MGLFVKPVNPSKQIPIKLVEKYKDEFKKKHPKKNKNKNKTKKRLIKTPR